jgi:glycosyltransferase involved in cell wall biosynthesis
VTPELARPNRVETVAPRISIITPTYNRRDALLRAIASVRGQTEGSFEHIIADDGSTDGTEQAVAALGEPRIVYLRLGNRRGANAARNAALQVALAPVTTLLDSDDVYLPHRLATTLAFFDRNPELSVLISSFRTSGAGREIVNRNVEAYLPPARLEQAVAAQAIYMAGPSITLRTAALRAAGGFDEALPRFQDGDLLMRLAQTHGAYLSGAIDWVKHVSPDAITATQPSVPAYAALCRRNPAYRRKFPQILRYMVARAVLAEITGLHPVRAWREFRASRADPFHYTAGDLVSGYLEGKRQRNLLRAEIGGR